jgi:CubicO group peptidase (beta-lactamase class C family)/D-alanyl-D-alanine dipeptidase/predicted GH43/DUF377 family glycosyl hydrolase
MKLLRAVAVIITLTAPFLMTPGLSATDEQPSVPIELQKWLQPQEWRRDTDGPILELGQSGDFDDTHVFAPCVANFDDKYHLWYSGSQGTVAERVFDLGLATGTDGRRFTKHSHNPVFRFGDGKHSILTATLLRQPDGSVLREDGKLRMWFTSTHFSGGTGHHALYETRSSDGVTWDAPSEALLDGVYAPTVLKEGNEYRMWYTDVSSEPWVIRLATSADGRGWQVHPDPLLKPEADWEQSRLFYPAVLKADGVYLMWYGSYWNERANSTAIGLAASLDGYRWFRNPHNPVLRPDPDHAWESHYTTSQSVIRNADGSFRIWYASRKKPPFVNKYFALNTATWQGPTGESNTVRADGRKPVTDYAPAIARLKAAAQHEVAQKQLPAFSISLVDDDRVVWAEGFGYQDAAKKIPATSDTVYRVGSVSKLFTDLAVLQLVEEGKLDLDAPVQKYLPDFRPRNPHGTPLTLRQMMSHQSGLVRESPVGHYFDPDEPTLHETVASLNQTSLVYKPETKTKYSNAAIAVVGAVLETQLDVSHPQRVRQSILNPLDMRNSSFVVTPALEPRLATGWMRTYDGRRFEAPTFLLGTGPAGNLYSSVLDLSKFLSCLFDDGKTSDGRILSHESLKLMTTPITDADGKSQGFGLGFHIQTLDEHTKIGHGGAVYGFSTQLEALPERRLGVVAASSLDGSNGVVGRLADYALRLMIATQDGKPLPTYRMTGPVPVERAKDLVGNYREVDGSRFTRINELNGDVFMQRGSFRYELRSAADDGSFITDDEIGFGTKVELQNEGLLLVGDAVFQRQPDHPPDDIPDHWRGLIGEYGWDHNTLYILEDQGQLYALIEWFYYYPLKEVSENVYEFPDYGLYHGEGLMFSRTTDGTAKEVVAAEVRFARREVGTKDGETFRIKPVKPIDKLRSAAMAASPPPESGEYLKAELTELATLDKSIKLDIRYATTNNFTGAVFYKQPRAFMQRPAAEAVVRANQRLKAQGLGLLIHDAYRPWHVTKMFWDATPDALKDFVANPANGSRHNRGCAVDLTLYDLETGKPIQMVAGYDEFSPRSFPQYPGGTSRQRWYRELLRRTMEAEGFTVYEYEWWHFDFRDWKKYRIGNATFEGLVTE